jgi:hypothetical protein
MDWHQNFILDAFKDIHLFKPVFQQPLSPAGARRVQAKIRCWHHIHLQRKRHQIINDGTSGDLAKLATTLIGKAHRRANRLAGN